MIKGIKESRKDHIQEVAQNLFKEKGYAATSMRDLANEVGIEAASLYSHITSKEEILRTICFDMADQFFAGLHSIETTDLPDDKKLEQAIISHIDVIARNRNASAVFFHDWRHLGEPFNNDFKLMRRRYENHFKKIIEHGIEQKIFINVDTTFTVRTLFSAMNWTYDWFGSGKNDNPQIIAEKITSLILQGLTKK
jgi:TetR/AcrR family transcriptional regulator, cholesterol catabolism regulator